MPPAIGEERAAGDWCEQERAGDRWEQEVLPAQVLEERRERTVPTMVDLLSSYYCGSEVCDEKTEEYCIVNKTHQYASYDEAPLHCKFGSDKLKLWLTSFGSIKCSVPCLNPDAYWLVNDLDCGCSISLTFPMGVWLDPNASIQAAVVNVTGRHSNQKAHTDRLIPCLLVRR